MNRFLILLVLWVGLSGCVSKHAPDVKPNPPQPVTPVPGPPQPVVPVTPSVEVAKGFRVIMLWDPGSPNTQEQLNILGSSEIYQYLNTHCVKNANGVAEWKKWTKDPEFSDLTSETMKQLYKDAAPLVKNLPAVIIAVDGKAKYYDISQAKVDDVLKLLKDAGGP